jgi:putative DNA primase/helicase
VWKSYNPELENPIGVGSLYKLERDLNPTTHTDGVDINLSDVANGQRFANMFRGCLLSVRDTPRWIVWKEGVGWTEADSTVPMKAAKAVLADMRDKAAQAVREGKETAKKKLTEVTRTSKANNMAAMIKLSESEEGMSVGLNELDNDEFLLGVNNGVLDLEAGKLIEPDPNVLVVKRAYVDFHPDADCPRFKLFLREIIPIEELRSFLVRVLAYLLTGSVREQLWLFLVGDGNNGKSVLLRVLEAALGDYAKKINNDMIMKGGTRQQGAAAPDLLLLQGLRFIYGNETKEGHRLDDARVKELTGGDTITGRALNSNHYVSFNPTHKMVIAGNNYPIVSDDSHGFWRRVVVFPFDVTFSEDEIDKDLEKKLLTERAGILNLLLEGMADWLSNGLQVPKALTNATNKYRSDSDTINQFITEECSKRPDNTVSKKECYAAYREWAIANGLLPLSSRRFSTRLTKHGLTVMTDQRTWQGLSLRPSPPRTFAELQK